MILRDAINAFYDGMTAQNRVYTGGSRMYFRLNCDRPPPGGPSLSGYFVPGSGAFFPQVPPKLTLFVG